MRFDTNILYLAGFSVGDVNSYILWCVAATIAGLPFFLLGLYVGRQYWKRFRTAASELDVEVEKRNNALSRQKDKLEQLRRSEGLIN